MALIGRPGANKSHPLSFAMKPFLDYDYEQNKLFEEQYSKFEEKMCMSRDVYKRQPARRPGGFEIRRKKRFDLLKPGDL